jgi:hypothetical protein
VRACEVPLALLAADVTVEPAVVQACCAAAVLDMQRCRDADGGCRQYSVCAGAGLVD